MSRITTHVQAPDSRPDVAPTLPAPLSWQQALPRLTGARVRLRELRRSDAWSLFAMLATEEVTRFISPPPTTVEDFERFIDWTLRQRAAGAGVCFAITIHDIAIGIIQVRQTGPGFETADWGFAIGSEFWGKRIFIEAATLVLAFLFGTIGVHRVEARASVRNGRGNGALRKLGAVQEAVLRRSFRCRGEYHDQLLWVILRDEWRRAEPPRRSWGTLH